MHDRDLLRHFGDFTILFQDFSRLSDLKNFNQFNELLYGKDEVIHGKNEVHTRYFP